MKSPHELTSFLQGLSFSSQERLALNKNLANHTRRFFRRQISQQRDIDNNPYQERRKRKLSVVSRGVRGKHGAKHKHNRIARHTLNNKNMLLGVSRALRTSISEDEFGVGLSGVAGRIGRTHNDGEKVTFTKRLNGYYNRRTGKWEGGIKVKSNYEMTKRTFIGWTPSLVKELQAIAVDAMLNGESA
ncbi:virion morphogenesis protein [Vibrio scophthalmi]|uniref:virion morphogenesis protein n=1 Tax=Vibrio scophthalmi TaxID=45658 RepID=UPI0009F3DCD4